MENIDEYLKATNTVLITKEYYDELCALHRITIKQVEMKLNDEVYNQIKKEIKKEYRSIPKEENHPQRTDFYIKVMQILDRNSQKAYYWMEKGEDDDVQ